MGMIQTSQRELETFYAMALPGFLDYLKVHGTSVDRVEMATTIEGITSLPGRYRLGGVEKNVLVPLELLTKGVDIQIEACREATLKANTAAENATAAASRVDQAIADVESVKQAALDATAEAIAIGTATRESKEACEAATEAAVTATALCREETVKCLDAIKKSEDATAESLTATTKAVTAAIRAETSAENADSSAARADISAAGADRSAEAADLATQQSRNQTALSEIATKAAGEAANRLNALSDHRDEIRDGYWWRWDEETGEWYNTGEIAKGNVMFATFELDPFTGILTMFTDEEYTGANFELDENGILTVVI